MSTFKLRDYQIEDLYSMIEAARRAQGRGSGPAERVLCILPTGAGKTVLMLAFALEMKRRFGWRTLITVPYRNLVYQTVEKIEEHQFDLSFGLVGDGNFNLEGDVVIAVQASLTADNLQKIERNAFQIVVCDEAHHAAAETYKLILDYFESAKLIVGMTATYIRGDGISIASDKYFPNVIVWNTVGQLTRAGYLVEAYGYYKHTNISLDNVKVRRGKFVEGQLSHAVNTTERNNMVVDAWFEFMEGLPACAYCVDINHARDMAEEFNRRGVPAAPVWGTMPKKEYRKVMEDYFGGKILVLPNAKLLGEGWDAPLTTGILMAKPITKTAINVLVPQWIGRALRPDTRSGKTHAVIVEMRDKPKKRKGEEEDISVSALAGFVDTSEKEMVCGRIPLHDQASRSRALRAWNDRQKLLDELSSEESLQERFDVIERLARISAYAWVPLGSTLYMPLVDDDFIEIVEETPWSYEVRISINGELSIEQVASNRMRALEIADRWVTSHVSNKSLILRDAEWRRRDPSAEQLKYAHALTHLPVESLKSLSCGQVSDLIKSARALLVKPSEKLPVIKPSGGQPESNLTIVPHAWQVQHNFF